MARRLGREAVYEIADQFRKRCLTAGKSLLWPQQASWTPTNLSALWKAFIDHPDTGKRSFLEKWHDQLRNEPEDVHRIAADLMAFYSLFPDSSHIGKQTKLRDLKTIISWKLIADQPNLEMVESAFEEGLASPGRQYLTGRPWQIAYYLEFSRRALTEKIDLTHVAICKHLADEVRNQVQSSASARHILLHLLFPEHFEPIASESYKASIVGPLSAEAGPYSDLDEALLNIRETLAKKLGTENFNFWDEQIKPLWPGRTLGEPPGGDGARPKVNKRTKRMGMPDVQRISQQLQSEGFLFSETLVKNYLLAIRTKPFVLLTGTSGGGKTALTRLIAQALDEPYIVVPVKPNWTDSRDLLGFYNPISRKYVRTQALNFILKANEEYKKDRGSARRYHLCLDEMNLSRVEYYFAELLSALERPDREIYLHSEQDSEIPHSVVIPPNFLVVGTVNIDETVQPFSDKVKDRANTIAVPIELEKYAESLVEWNPPQDNPIKQRAFQFAKTEKGQQVVNLLLKIGSTLSVQRVQFGYRTMDEILAYMAENHATELLSFVDALDFQVAQRILPKVQGRGTAFEKLLACLDGKCGACLNCIFATEGLIRAAERIERMAAILKETGYTSYDAAS